MSKEPTSSSAQHEIPKTSTHGGLYFLYELEYPSNLVFEVSKKYDPLLRYIGSGRYGAVCAAKNFETKEDVAIKKIENVFNNKCKDLSKRTLREIMILRNLQHENIVAIKDIIPPPLKEFNDVYIVFDLMDKNFDEVINSYQLTDDDCQNYLYQLLRGLKYAHSANVLHRDLKPANLLLNTSTKVLKIADFGLARIKSNIQDPMTEDVVTRLYRAPELLLHDSEYTEAIDIWSVGCIFVEMVTLKSLFSNTSSGVQLKHIVELVGSPDDSILKNFRDSGTLKQFKKLKNYARKNFAEVFPCMSEDAVDLLDNMLVFDPNKRISAHNALGHNYFKKCRDITKETVSATPLGINFEHPMNNIEDIKEEIRRQSKLLNP